MVPTMTLSRDVRQDTTARVRVAHSGELIAELRGHTGPVNTAVFSADDPARRLSQFLPRT